MMGMRVRRYECGGEAAWRSALSMKRGSRVHLSESPVIIAIVGFAVRVPYSYPIASSFCGACCCGVAASRFRAIMCFPPWYSGSRTCIMTTQHVSHITMNDDDADERPRHNNECYDERHPRREYVQWESCCLICGSLHLLLCGMTL